MSGTTLQTLPYAIGTIQIMVFLTWVSNDGTVEHSADLFHLQLSWAELTFLDVDLIF